MARRALNSLEFGGVRHPGNIAMAVRALEGAMDRLIEGVFIDLKRNGFTVVDLLQARHAVATKTNVLGQRLRAEHGEV